MKSRGTKPASGRTPCKLAAFVALIGALGTAGSPSIAEIRFADVSDSAGFSPAMSADIPAGGIAVADFDGNGWPDIFVTGYFLPNRLFFNQGDGTFSENDAINQQLAGSLCSVTAAADFDNDGWPDLYVGCRGDHNHLFRNLAGAGFEDATPPELQHDPFSQTAQRTDAVAWGDIDGNGLLDLFIGIYPTSSSPDLGDPDNLDRIVLNLGGGQWQDIALSLPADKLARTALAATFTDIDLDGDADLYVINDKYQGNVLWRNDGPGCDGWCLTDVAVQSGADRPVFGMGIAVGDIDRDGMSDLFFSSINEQILLRMTGQDPLQFEEVQQSAGVDYPGVGWATIFADFDLDGAEDAYLAIGSKSGAPGEYRDQLFRNNGLGTFESVIAGSGLEIQWSSQAAALIDYDRDGRLDIVIGHHNAGYRLYRNITTGANGFIALELIGGAGINQGAVGARVDISTPDGVQWRELRAGDSRGASHQPLLHFGTGSATEAEVTVHWSDGASTDFGSLATGQYHSLTFDPGVVFEESFDSDLPPGGTLNLGGAPPGSTTPEGLIDFFNNGAVDDITVDCTVTDPDGVLTVTPDPISFTITPGATESAGFQCTPPDPQSFSATVSCAIGGDPNFSEPVEYTVLCRGEPPAVPTTRSGGLIAMSLMLLLVAGFAGRRIMARSSTLSALG